MPERSAARTVLMLTSVAAFMGYLDVTIVNVSFPSIQADFSSQATNSVIWVLDIYSVVLAGLLIAVGRASDVIGHRKMFLVGVALFTSASAVCAIAPSLSVLVAARGLQAFGAAIFTPSSLALILSLHERESRPAAVATWTAAAALAAAVGPALGGALTGGGGTWRWIFIVNVPVGLAVVAIGAARVPRLHSRGSIPDPLSSVLLLAAAFLAALAITRGRIWGWGSPATVVVAASSLLALGLFGVQNARSSRRILERVFLGRVIVVSNAATFFVSLAFFAYLLTGVLFLTHVWGYSILQGGLAMSPAPACAIVAALISSRAPRRQARTVLICGSALIALFGGGAFASLGARADLPLWLGLGAVLGGGIGASLPLLSALAVEGVEEARFATASALNSTVRQFAAVLAFAAVAAVLGNGTLGLLAKTYGHIWIGVGTCGAVAAAISTVLPVRRKQDEPAAWVRQAGLGRAGPPAIGAAEFGLAPSTAVHSQDWSD